MCAVKEIGYYDIQSPYGYGGPLSNSDDEEFLDKAWKIYTDWCMEQHVLVEFIRFHPALKNYNYYRGEKFFDRKTIWIDCESYYEDINSVWDQYEIRTRTAVRKAIKNDLTVEWCSADEFLNFFPSMYAELMGRLAASKYYEFCNEYFSALAKLEHTLLAVCKKNDEPIAGAMFLTSGNNMEYHLSAGNDIARKHGATNLILYEANKKAVCEGLGYLHLGGGTNTQADNQLLFFKKGFSKYEGEFYIGKTIFDVDMYESYKQQWMLDTGKPADRVLFYKF